jgi:hypothetical protein
LQFRTSDFLKDGGFCADSPSSVLKITYIKRTCFAYPSQWEGKTESGYVYVRFRGGTLAVRFGPTIEDAIAGPNMFEWHDGDDFGGFMEYDELKKITAEVLDLPDVEIAEEPYGIPPTPKPPNKLSE